MIRRSRDAGFTFIELMVVVTVIGLMAAIVVANLDGMTETSRLNAAARSLGNTLLVVRDVAASQGRELQVEIDVDHQRWRIVDIPSPTDVPDPEERREKTDYGEWESPPDDVRLESLEFARTDIDRRGTAVIGFDADGQISPAGFVAFFRVDGAPEEEGVTVEVTGLTGAVAYVRGRKRSEEVRDPDDF